MRASQARVARDALASLHRLCSHDARRGGAAITKRVLGLLAVVLLGGAALFFLGLGSLR